MSIGPANQTGVTAAIVTAGGVGRRFGSCQPKQFADLAGWPVLAHTLARFDQTTAVDQVVVVAPADHLDFVRRDLVETLGFTKVKQVVAGGGTRQESVCNGFLALADDVDLVLIHDGVRPLVRPATIEAVVEAAREYGAAISAVPVRDTLKRVEDGVIQATLDRRLLWQAQTPQAFDRALLARAMAEAKNKGFVGTDEAALVERMGHPIRVVTGSRDNIKITQPEDLALAEALMADGEAERDMRVGLGFDVHTLVAGRKLMLGGIEVPFDRGLAGHSDADVLAHALCDALLGAAGLGDLGTHFPDSSPKWAGVSGLRLLELTAEKVRAAGFRPQSADVTLMAQKPKIKDLARRMAQAMAGALGLDPESLNVKATTTEGLGPVGREEGLAAMAVAVLTRRN